MYNCFGSLCSFFFFWGRSKISTSKIIPFSTKYTGNHKFCKNRKRLHHHDVKILPNVVAGGTSAVETVLNLFSSVPAGCGRRSYQTGAGRPPAVTPTLLAPSSSPPNQRRYTCLSDTFVPTKTLPQNNSDTRLTMCFGGNNYLH